MKRILIAILLLSSTTVSAGNATGKVNMLEVWKTGNVAFRLEPSVTACNTQFIINYSENGAKNMYAAVLAAKVNGKTVTVTYEDSCGLAENYGGEYNIPKYILVNDN